MLVNVTVISYVHVCEQARWARSAGNSAIENLCIIIIIKEVGHGQGKRRSVGNTAPAALAVTTKLVINKIV